MCFLSRPNFYPLHGCFFRKKGDSSAGRLFWGAIYLDNEILRKLGGTPLHDATKCDLIVPCISSNVRLCRLIKGLGTTLPTDQWTLEEIFSNLTFDPQNSKQKNPVSRERKDVHDMFELLSRELGAGCM